MSVKSKKSDSASDPSVIGLHMLLAELLHREMEPQLRQLLIQPEVLEVFAQIDPACREYLTRDWSEADYEQVAVDYCELFILPESSAAPRAAAWLPIGGAITAEAVDAVVTGFLSEWEIQVPPSYQYLAYDHVSLILYVSAVIRQADSEQVDEFEEIALRSWIGQFGLALSGAKNPLYKAVGVLLSEQAEA